LLDARQGMLQHGTAADHGTELLDAPTAHPCKGGNLS
jgi:hypothetical protein